MSDTPPSATLSQQLTIEVSLIKSHLEALEREYVTLKESNSMAATLIREAIHMKKKRLEVIERQRENNERGPTRS